MGIFDRFNKKEKPSINVHTEGQHNNVTVHTTPASSHLEALEREVVLLRQSLEDKAKLENYNEEEIFRLRYALSVKEEELAELKAAYEAILAQTKEIKNPDTLYQQATQKLAEQRPQDALDILSEEALEARATQEADNWILRADILLLENQFKEAQKSYKRAVTISPSYNSFFKLAYFYQKQLQLDKAVKNYEKTLKWAHSDEDRATTLNNLAILYHNRNEYKVAEQAYSKALVIRRNLAKQNPSAFLPDVATTLNNLANLYRARNEYKKAEKAYDEALEKYQNLAAQNPSAYLPDVAIILNNLGALYYNRYEYKKAEQAYNEALAIRRNLAAQNPAAYLPYVATTLNNLANLYSNRNQYKEAEDVYNEALAIRRNLAKQNPSAFLPDVATTLNNLAVFYQENIPNQAKSTGYAQEALHLITPYLAIGMGLAQQIERVCKEVLADWERM